MNAENFEERLLQELKGYVGTGTTTERRLEGRRATTTAKRRSSWRLAGGGIGVAAVMGLAMAMTTGSAASSNASGADAVVHFQNANFTVDSQPSGAVVITILNGKGLPDVPALRDALTKAGIAAKVLTGVPTCQELAQRPGTPSPAYSAAVNYAQDSSDFPTTAANGDFAYSVDTSPQTQGTTLWIMFSGTLSTMVVERTHDWGLQPNCI